jgi:tetratricopeptide (TPR) repeat protein
MRKDAIVISKEAPARSLEEKLQRARSEGRMQTALDFAKQIAKQTPTPENQRLLRDVSLERGEQLLREGKDKEAVVVFGNTLKLGADADVQARIGVRFAQAGDLAAAVEIMQRIPEGPARTKLLGHLVDAALQRDQRDRLAPEFHAGFDSVGHAFARYERGQDVEALDTLQAIGLRSPFLEWRVLLRGLSAYSRGDDAKALENWQRLDVDRLPWRLVAPFRFRIDEAFRSAQPVETAKRLTSQLDRIASSMAPTLRSIDQDIHNDVKPAVLLDRIDTIAAAFKERHPTLVPKLVRALYGVILVRGMPQDVRKLSRMLPPLADDPDHLLLWGLLATEHRMRVEAVGYLWEYEEAIGKNAKILGDDTALARAMLWERFGDLVANMDERITLPNEKSPLMAERCFRRSIELAPTRRLAYVKLGSHLARDPRTAKQAVEAAYAMVKQFPNETFAWVLLGEAADLGKDFVESERCYAEAVRSDPLNPKLRTLWESAVWKRIWAAATKEARKKTPDLAAHRPELERAVAAAKLRTAARLADWAMLEHRLGNRDFAQELRTRAFSRPGDRLAAAIAFHLVAASIAKIDKETKTEFAAALDTAFETPPTFEELLAVLAVLDAWQPAIKGRPAILKRLNPRFAKKALKPFHEEQMIALGRAMVGVVPVSKLRDVVHSMRDLFPHSPELAIVHYDVLEQGHYGWGPPVHLLEEASELAAGLPRERQQRILEEVQARRVNDTEVGNLAEQMLDFLESEGIDL